MLARLVKSFCIWYLYVPHLAFLRLIGPRAALLLTHFFSLLHWLAIMAGSDKRARRAIAAAYPQFRCDASLGTILRRYVFLKHQRFVEWYLYPTPRGRQFVRETYANFEGREHLDQALAGGKGVVVLMFHYGMGKMIFAALQELGYKNHHHVFRGMTYAGETTGYVAKKALDTFVKSEENSGLSIIYHKPFLAFTQMARVLRKNEVLGMNGDGMMGTDFVDAPFLGGEMPFPTGPARMAAQSGAPIVSIYALPDGWWGHKLVAHPPIWCKADKPEAVAACVREYVALLDDYTKRYPWAWWTWRRLALEPTADGRMRYKAIALAQEDGSYHTAQAVPAQSGGSANGKPASSPAPAKPGAERESVTV